MARLATIDVLMRLNSEEFNRKLQDVGARADQLGRKMTDVGKTMTTRVTAPLVGLGVASAKMAADFETSMSKVVGLVGVAREEVDEMAPAVKAMAAEFGISSNKAAEALFFVTSAGLRGNEAMEVLEASLKASAVGLGEVSTIADLATSVVNAYGSEVMSGAGATDILTAAVREGKLEADQLSGAMGQVLPIASAMGVQFHEVGAAFAAMSRTGTSASGAATQLRGIMMGLLKPTAEAEKTLAEMGLSAQMLRQQIKDQGLLETLETLAAEFEGNDEAASKVFGSVEALAGVLDLMGANAEGTRQIFESMEDTTGALDAAFSEMAQTAGFKLKQAMVEVGNSMMVIGDVVLPHIVKLAAMLGELAKRFQGLSPELQGTIVALAGLLATVGPVLIVLGAFASAISKLIALKAALAASTLTLAGILGAPLAAPIAAVVAILGTLYLAWKALTFVVPLVFDIVEAVYVQFKRLASILLSPIKPIERLTDAFRWMWDRVVGNSYVPDMVDGIGREFGRLPELMVNPALRATQRVSSAFGLMADQVGESMKKVGSAFDQFGAGGASVGIITDALGIRLGGQAGERQRQAQEAAGIAQARGTGWAMSSSQQASHAPSMASQQTVNNNVTITGAISLPNVQNPQQFLDEVRRMAGIQSRAGGGNVFATVSG